MKRETELSRVFVELADTLVADFDVVDFLHTLTLRCVDLFDVDAAGLMLADAHNELRLVARVRRAGRVARVARVAE